MDPDRLRSASEEAVEGLKERTESGHRAAGRIPPSESTAARTSGAHRAIDTSIRGHLPITEDSKLLQPAPRDDFTQTDPWRVMRIMSEFIEGFDVLADVTKGVAIFGSARTGPARGPS